MPNTPSMSVFIPSNRKLADCAPCIQSAVDFCRLHGLQIVVSDNSGDAEKKEALSRIFTEDNMIYQSRPPCGMIENWFHAFDATGGDFVLMMGDDDRLFSLGSITPEAEVAADVVGIRPTIQGYAAPRGITNINFSPIKSNNPMERIVEHIQSSRGSNVGICSFWRRETFQSIMELHYKSHPTKGSYCDWAIMNALVSSGRVIRCPMSCYFYDISNWLGDAAFVQAQVERAFQSAGLPSEAAAYIAVLNAVDSYIYINRKASPLPVGLRRETAVFCFSRILENYTQKIPVPSRHENAQEIAALSHRLVGSRDTAAQLGVVRRILAALQPGLDEKYADFYETATGEAWPAE